MTPWGEIVIKTRTKQKKEIRGKVVVSKKGERNPSAIAML